MVIMRWGSHGIGEDGAMGMCYVFYQGVSNE